MKSIFLRLLLGLFPSLLFAAPAQVSLFIKVDQFGYFCDANKVAIIADPQVGFNAAQSFSPGTGTNQYQIRRWTDDVVVFSGTITAWNGGATHAQSGDRGWWFNFSTVTTPGSYYVYDLVNNVGSVRFEIGNDVYNTVLKHAMRTYFYQRIGIAKTTAHTPAAWTEAAWYTGANQDAAARSRWDKSNPATARNLSGGWFDAGDPNKYTTFAQSAILDLLEAYRMNPSVFADDYNIPESGNGVPDILDEVVWELDFLKKMQDATATNGFFLKVGVDNFDYYNPPSTDTRPRYYLPECTSATLSGCAMFAAAGIVYQTIPSRVTYGQNLVTRAEQAWARAVVTTANFTTFETNCDDLDIKSGDADNTVAAQRQSALIAAIYLFEATGNSMYRTFVDNNYLITEPTSNNWWGPYSNAVQIALLRYADFPNATASVATAIRNQKAGQNAYLSITDYTNQTDLYRSHMPTAQYHWGSNTVKGHAGCSNLDFIEFNINPGSHTLYRETAEQYMHYFHGQNPISLVHLSNMYAYGAENCANEIYHGWFDDGTVWDNAITSTYGPAPGYVVGGANGSFSVTTISPPAGQPAQKGYKDWNTGWPENSWEITEPAIYSQASYIKLLSRVIGLAAACDGLAAPTNLTAQPSSSSAIQLAWVDNASGESGYEIERASSGAGPWTLIATTAANATSYSNTGLTAATTYHYRVRAFATGQVSGYSNTAQSTTNSTTAKPAKPTNLAGTALSSTSVELTWTDNANNETSFTIQRALASAGPWTSVAPAPPANTTTRTVTGLLASTTYYFRIRANNASGNSGWSLLASVTTQAPPPPPTIPAAPSALTATVNSASQITLSWTDNSTNESGFQVYQRIGSGSWARIPGNVPPNITTLTVSGLNPTTLYSYRVRSFNQAGNSGYSNIASGTTLSATTSLQVYADALATDWADWSWSATRNFSNTSPVQQGIHSISCAYSGQWGGLSLRKETAVLTTNLQEVRFYVYSSSAIPMVFYSQTTDGGGSSPTINFTTNAGQWKEIVITAAQLANPATIKRLNFQITNTTGTIFYDDIRFVYNGPVSKPNATIPADFRDFSEKMADKVTWKVAPNPIQQELQVYFDLPTGLSSDGNLRLMELGTGRLLWSQPLQLLGGTEVHQYLLPHLPSGTYVLEWASGSELRRTKVLVVNH